MRSTACPTVAADGASGGAMRDDPHLRLTPLQAGTAADSARARQFVAEMRRVLAKYQDVHVAEADGYRMFLQDEALPVYHFTSWRRAVEAMVRFDPARPTSLLYHRDEAGHFQLLGAMYTAPAAKTDAELDALIPLSVARWHEHVDWCVPLPGQASRWQERRDGRAVFGFASPVATLGGCDAVGGQFRPRIHDWSIHVYAFAGDDPRAIWCVDRDHDEMMGP